MCGTTFYPATAAAQAYVANGTLSTVYSIPDVGTIFWPTTIRPASATVGGPNVTRGIIWLSDSCVDPIAYAPLVSSVNNDGYVAFLLDPTGVADYDADYKASYQKTLAAMDYYGDQFQYWAIGGHGRGATLASRIARAAYPKITGLYTLAGVIDSDIDLSSLYMVVAAIYGTADSTVSESAVLATKPRLPEHAYFQAVSGAGHSDFGLYTFTDPAGDAVTQTNVLTLLTAPSTTVVVPNGPSILRAVLQGLHIPKVMPEALVYAASSSFSNYVHVTGKYYAFIPTSASSNKTGVIYHVGAYVDARAYFPSMRALADKGFVVVIPVFPLNYVLANMNLAFDVINDFPYVKRWVSAGHSLGVVGAGYVGFQNSSLFVGMLFHDSGPRTNVSTFPGPIAIAYGADANTGARLPPSSLLYLFYFANNKLPKTTQFYPIEGGNHYQFGWYNDQGGIPPATISRQVETSLIVESAFLFMLQWYYLP